MCVLTDAESSPAGAIVAANSDPEQRNAHVVRYLRLVLHGLRDLRRGREAADRYQLVMRTARSRVRALITTDQEADPMQTDLGANGPAALARPRDMEQVATGDKRWGREKTDVVRYQAAHPWDHYERGGQLTDRQLKAGWNLTRFYTQGYTAMLALPSYGSRATGPMSEEEDLARSIARKEYDRLASLIPHPCRHAMACMVRGEFPRMTDRLRYLREACDVLADAMQIERVTT